MSRSLEKFSALSRYEEKNLREAEIAPKEKIVRDMLQIFATRSQLVELHVNAVALLANLKYERANADGFFAAENSYLNAIDTVRNKIKDLDLIARIIQTHVLFEQASAELFGNSAQPESIQEMSGSILALYQTELNKLQPNQKKEKSVGVSEQTNSSRGTPDISSRFDALDMADVIVPQRELEERAVAVVIGLSKGNTSSREKVVSGVGGQTNEQLSEQDQRHAAWDLMVKKILLSRNSPQHVVEAAERYVRHQSAKAGLELVHALTSQSSDIVPISVPRSRLPYRHVTRLNTSPTPVRLKAPDPYQGPAMSPEKIVSIAGSTNAVIAHVRKNMEEFDRIEGVKTVFVELPYNVEVGRRLGLERQNILASPAAQTIIDSIMNGSLPIDDIDEEEALVERWQHEVSNIPLPAVPRLEDFGYLKALSHHQVYRHFKNNDLTECIPDFGTFKVLLVDTWAEQDRESGIAMRSVLLERLGLVDGTVNNISREQIEKALWENGDTFTRTPTTAHRALLQELGAPKGYEFRLIRQDEYARLAVEKGWGEKNLRTHFDGYVLDGVERSCLIGGRRADGGASHVREIDRNVSRIDLATRLVLARKEGNYRNNTFSTKDTGALQVENA
jgi:hypothetical protein